MTVEEGDAVTVLDPEGGPVFHGEAVEIRVDTVVVENETEGRVPIPRDSVVPRNGGEKAY